MESLGRDRDKLFAHNNVTSLLTSPGEDSNNRCIEKMLYSFESISNINYKIYLPRYDADHLISISTFCQVVAEILAKLKLTTIYVVMPNLFRVLMSNLY